MDGTDPTRPQQDTPGAPELSKGVKPPSAPLVSDRQVGPVFRAEPTPVAAEKAPSPTDTEPPAPLNDETESTTEESPPLDEHQARIEYLKSLRENQPKKKKRGKVGKVIGIIFLVLIISGAGAAGAYYYLDKSGSKDAPKTSQSTNKQPEQQTEEPATDEQPATVETEEYSSDKFGLSLAHPVDWTPQQIGEKLTITSPVVTLTDASGQEASGRIVFGVRPRQDKPAEFTNGNVLTVLESEKVNYTQPSPSQRGSTYLSYLQYPTTKVKGGMDGIYVTGDFGYKYAQNVRISEISQVAPLINVTFVSCPDETCDQASQTPLNLNSTAWKTDTVNRPVVETLLKSIVLN